MPVPTHIFDPPFNIIRCSHAVLDVVDLNKSRAFYENTVGLHVEDSDTTAVYLRGSEEHQHHSLVLRKAPVAACRMRPSPAVTEPSATEPSHKTRQRPANASAASRQRGSGPDASRRAGCQHASKNSSVPIPRASAR